jgi:RNA recognition motif-containing protein
MFVFSIFVLVANETILTNITYKDLQDNFSQYGAIKSLKISINPDHSQKGFAYICFENQEDAAKAATADPNSFAFEAKDNR